MIWRVTIHFSCTIRVFRWHGGRYRRARWNHSCSSTVYPENYGNMQDVSSNYQKYYMHACTLLYLMYIVTMCVHTVELILSLKVCTDKIFTTLISELLASTSTFHSHHAWKIIDCSGLFTLLYMYQSMFSLLYIMSSSFNCHIICMHERVHTHTVHRYKLLWCTIIGCYGWYHKWHEHYIK